jgi:hypothetical protein
LGLGEEAVLGDEEQPEPLDPEAVEAPEVGL